MEEPAGKFITTQLIYVPAGCGKCNFNYAWIGKEYPEGDDEWPDGGRPGISCESCSAMTSIEGDGETPWKGPCLEPLLEKFSNPDTEFDTGVWE